MTDLGLCTHQGHRAKSLKAGLAANAQQDGGGCALGKGPEDALEGGRLLQVGSVVAGVGLK